MQNQPRTTSRQRRPQHNIQGEFTPGTLITVASIGAVVLILVVTFVADWLKTPEMSMSLTSPLFSPNGDGAFDLATINYNLVDDSRITARVYSGYNLVRTLLNAQSQASGAHFLTWDGRTDQGTLAADGTYRIEVSAGGAIRSTVQNVSIQVDTQPPVLQLANFNDGKQVNTPDLILEGVTEPGTVILLGVTAQVVPVDNSGRFRVQYKLAEGDNQIEIQAADPAGNTTRLLRTVSLVTEPPDIVLTSPLDNEWTNQQVLTIEGRTRPGAALTINQQAVRVDADGYFKHETILNEGDNSLRLVATDEVGNVAVLERTVHLKTGAATIQVSVDDGLTVADPNLQMTGKVEPGSEVTINGQIIPVSALGDFQYSAALNSGDNLLEIESRDQAGNVSRLTRRVVYNANGADSLSRIERSLDQLPMLVIPSIVLMAAILGFIYLRQNRVMLSLSVDPPVFSPVSFGEEKSLAISLDLNKTARVTLEVYDQQGNPRATILYNRRKIGRRHLFHWNGRDDRGAFLPAGEYIVQAEAGSSPLQVTSAVQVRIERPTSTPQAQTPAYVRGYTQK